MSLRHLAATTGLAALLAGAAHAGPFADFESDLRTAYGTYRVALFKTNSGDADASATAVKSLANQWTKLTDRWEAAPPPQYEDDSEFSATLDAVGAVATEAAAQVAEGTLPQAHETLEEIRDLVGDLHLRNGQIGFSDRMNAYHAHMEDVLMAGYEAKGPDALPMLAGDAAVLSYLASEILGHPGPDADDPKFQSLVSGLTASVEALSSAVLAGDWDAALAAIGGLKKPYAVLFLNFG